MSSGNAYIPHTKLDYLNRVRGSIKDHFKLSTVMSVPKLEKIVASTGVGDAITDGRLLDSAVEELSLICGQRAVRTKARVSIANFKLRKGMEIGCKVTLRGNVMYDFFSRLINIALPRVKDFRGLNPNSFDGHGNYSLGIDEQIIFPEINYDTIQKISGINIVIVTSTQDDVMAKYLLDNLGLPFREG